MYKILNNIVWTSTATYHITHGTCVNPSTNSPEIALLLLECKTQVLLSVFYGLMTLIKTPTKKKKTTTADINAGCVCQM